MAELYDVQLTLANDILKIGVNLRKTGYERRNAAFFKKCLDSLEELWKEYQFNHDRMCTEVSPTHDYFKGKCYENTSKSYQSIKANISQMYQQLLDNSSTSEVTVKEHSKQQLAEEEEGEDPDGEAEEQEHVRRSPQKQPRMVHQGTNSKLDDLMRKQSANFKAFRRTVSNIKLDSITEKWEFEDVLKTLQTRWSAIDSLHWEIDCEIGEENEEYEEMFNIHEKQFNSLKRDINSKMWSVSHRDQSTPRLEIPIFSGNYNQWVSFKDLFTEAIHNNPSLSKAQKMQFLKSKVKGEAESLIQHLQISSDNYTVCWEILNHRFNNNKLIFSSHMNILLGLPNMQNQSVFQIKKLHDTTLECLHAIQNLGIDTSTWDPMVVHIMSQKLDSETYSEYIDSLKNSRDLPVLQEFLDFLEAKFISLESARRKDYSQQRSSHTNSQQNASSSSNQKKYFNQNYNNSFNNNTKNKMITKSLHVSNIRCPLCNADHGLYSCKTFLDSSNEQRLKTANKLRVCINCLFSHNGNKCISTKRCLKCQGQHNTLLHEALVRVPTSSSSSAQVMKSGPKQKENVGTTSHVSYDESPEILLATAMIKVLSSDGTYHLMRALIDQGSQLSLVSEHAAQQLWLKRQHFKGVVFGIGHNETNCKGVVNITCKSTYSDYSFTTEALIMNDLIKHLPNKTFKKPSWSLTENINLADPEFYLSRPVDILLGADIYAEIMLGGILRGEDASQPIAQQTKIGWLLCGSVKTFHCNVVINNIDDIHKFWEVEEISEQSDLSWEDQECINFYTNTTKRQQDGRYVVRLPLKEDLESKLGTSKQIAVAQFRNLERKFEKDKQLEQHYKTFMTEYSNLNHMKPAIGNMTPECYLPHHGILREESLTTKYRVVFNASSKTSTGYSLNDMMKKGPNLQHDLQSLLMKWRQYEFAYTSDIEKCYRPILVNEADQPLQRIIWRDSPKEPLQTFQPTTVTYGTKAAPFLALMTMKQLATDEQNNYPAAAQVLASSFYMDDLVHGSHSILAGKQLISDLISLLKSGGFNLRKWAANKPELIEHTTDRQHGGEELVFNNNLENTSKTLGLCWNPKDDIFFFRCNFSNQKCKITKRHLLSEISKLFDPLGWLTPLSTKLKLLFQKLWKNNLQWDDEVSDDIQREWSKIKQDNENVKLCTIPRWLMSHEDDVIELHGFCDASQEAYACVVYAKIKNTSNVTLIAGKSKLVPHKKSLTLPKLELSSAYLLSKLMGKIQQCLFNKLEIYGWSDSMVTISWLKGDSNRWKPFVANRVKKITQTMPPESWRYVKSADNPADCASRGMLASLLVEHNLWWQGPKWLQTWSSENQTETLTFETNQETKNIQNKVNTVLGDRDIISELLEKYSSFRKITRILARILRTFIPTIRRKQLPGHLTLQELRKAKHMIVKYVQLKEFGTDMELLRHQGKVESKSKLLCLNPLVDNEGLLRVGGRLNNASISDEMKHPKIIPYNSRLAELLIDEAHQLTFHGGPRVTLANLRMQYWITSGYSAVKKQIRKCVVCRKLETNKQYQLMADLPDARVNKAPAFYHTGIDYTGFFDIKVNKGRSSRTTKGYVAVFICMVTKAVHLELVSDLTSSAFLAALRRMSARRGAPGHLYSDQGTNFVGANNRLQQEYQQFLQVFNNDLLTEVAEMNITWHFNAPNFPSGGGLWERAVRSLKFHLKRVIGEQKLTFEEFSTILAQIEACLNTRPLCPLTENIEDIEALTPAHFLTGRSGLTVIETEEDARTRWHLVNKLTNDLWKRWKSEYLHLLTARSKWLKPQRNMEVGDLVVIHEDNIPAGKWAMGRVVDLHPGKDGLIRVVSLKTKSGIIRRPIIKLSLLPISTVDKGEKEQKKTQQNTTLQQQNNQQTFVRRVRSNFASIALALTLFLSIVTNVNGMHNITTLNDTQSLYFDPVAKINLIREKWMLVVYYNMSPYWEGTLAIDKVLTYINKTCLASDSGVCNMILPQLRHEFKEIEYYNTLLMSHHFYGRSRQRRGLINGVGHLANYLFGVLDSNFAEQYAEDIKRLKQNQQHYNNLLRNQTTVIESEYNLLKRTEDIITKQHKIINSHLNRLENMTNGVRLAINNISLIQEQITMSLTAINLLQNLKRTQETLLDIVTDVKHGHFSIHLLTPEQLRHELSVISTHLSDDITLPIDQSDVSKLYPLLQIKARMTSDYFIFQITFPLVNRDKYKLYHIIPIPHLEGKNTRSIVPLSEYIAVNLKKDAYLLVTSSELSTCHIQEESYICLLNKAVYHLNSDHSFCALNPETNNCKMRQATCTNQWIPLYHPSQFLFHCCNKYTIKVICGERVTVEHLQAAGVIYIEPGCILKGQDFTLHSNTQFANSLNSSSDIYIPRIDQLNHIINIAHPFTNNESNPIQQEDVSTALEGIRVQINQLKNNEMSSRETLSIHDVHHYAITYILVAVSLAGASVFLWRWARSRGARRAVITPTPDIELQSVSEVCAHNSANQHDRSLNDQSVVQVHSANKQNKACSPISRKSQGTNRH